MNPTPGFESRRHARRLGLNYGVGLNGGTLRFQHTGCHCAAREWRLDASGKFDDLFVDASAHGCVFWLQGDVINRIDILYQKMADRYHLCSCTQGGSSRPIIIDLADVTLVSPGGESSVLSVALHGAHSCERQSATCLSPHSPTPIDPSPTAEQRLNDHFFALTDLSRPSGTSGSTVYGVNFNDYQSAEDFAAAIGNPNRTVAHC